jgi:hypothetical protein
MRVHAHCISKRACALRVCACARMRVPIFGCVNVRVLVHACVCVCVCLCVRECVSVCLFQCKLAHLRARVRVCVYVQLGV